MNWVLALVALVLLSGAGCDHDPVVLDTHPLDVRGATGLQTESFYLEMDDGVKIAVDAHVPVNYPGGDRFPAIVEMARAWRNQGNGLSFFVQHAVRRGFAYVIVDERGTGASFDQWKIPFSERAIADVGEVIDWIVDQPWSNGMVGATGLSYAGMGAQQLAGLGHPALKAIVPMSDNFDLYEGLFFPGGVFNQVLAQGWSDIIGALDRNVSLEIEGSAIRQQPVDDDPSGVLLEAAVAGHAGNLILFEALSPMTFRDDVMAQGRTLDQVSTHGAPGIGNGSQVAVYHWGSWMDSGAADGLIRAFMSSSGPRRAVIGAWTNDLSLNALYGLDRWPSVPPTDVQWDEALNFFDDELRKEKPVEDRILRYFTMGENRWKATDQWPVPGTAMESWYLGPDETLIHEAPDAVGGSDEYAVDFQVRSSMEPRWLAPLGVQTWYSDRVSRDRHLLVYESSSLDQDTEVTGYPVVHLHLSSTHSDGAFFVYLEDVDAYGRVKYVTEGVFRAIHRKVSQDPSPWKKPTPYHSFRAADAEPMVPGEVVELAFGLQPTSYLFKEGHRIRIAIAGHDASAFRRIPQDGDPVVTVRRSQVYPSRIELPVVPR